MAAPKHDWEPLHCASVSKITPMEQSGGIRFQTKITRHEPGGLQVGRTGTTTARRRDFRLEQPVDPRTHLSSILGGSGKDALMGVQSHGRSATLPESTTEESHGTDGEQEFFKLGCVLLRILIYWATSAAANNIARRLTLLSRSSLIPVCGAGDTRAVAALLDLSESGAKQLLKRCETPSVKPGDEKIFRFSDLLLSRSQPTSSGTDSTSAKGAPACSDQI